MRHHVSRKKRALQIFLILLVTVVAIRLALPFVILHYANKSLADMDGYNGRIDDIDLSIIRGAYKIDSIYLNKVDTVTGKETEFFSASLIDLSIEWKALFKGSIAGEIIMEKPRLSFTKDKVEPKDIQKDSTDFKDLLDELMPLNINRFEVKNGILKYIDNTTTPKVNIEMTDTDIVALNLRNSYDSSETLPASVTARANIYDGTLSLRCDLNPLADDPTFDMNAELTNTNLVKLNEFFAAYAKADVNQGTFGLYTELAAKDGKFTGYVKPLIKDLDILGREDRDDNFFRQMWEAVVGGTAELFENQPRDRVATKVPLQGTVKELNTNVWYAIGVAIQNAFIQALQPTIDYEINLATVGNEKKEKKNFLERTFGKKDDNKKDEKKNEKEKG